ncbi:anaerobic ribonucleoside-triphosphate reductase activating protein [Luxibacter massiliensis]|uniref:anaerobic ribonucleoside-triphosphate reductase activating protein n=1 Tax=Luxibacter massiliensis TaxID=2219695 RepID=UPI000F0539CC|nr:anaerobic ribonucleoside-triphosphate reductase activating protein [Luxibacter massiliensis]
MNIQGLQKLTLLDYPEKVACTIFTAGCNFRCPFCHNASLVTHIHEENQIPEEEIFAFLRKRQGILDGVCITGGEPLLQRDIIDFVRKVKEIGYAVKLDTNGSSFEKLRQMTEQGLLDYIAMDIKNAPDKYGKTVGIEDYNIENILRTADYLLSDKVSYEFRTTVVRELHKREDFAAIGRWISGARRYYLQGFKDSGDLIVPGLRGYTREIMEQALEIVRRNVPHAELRGVE